MRNMLMLYANYAKNVFRRIRIVYSWFRITSLFFIHNAKGRAAGTMMKGTP